MFQIENWFLRHLPKNRKFRQAEGEKTFFCYKIPRYPYFRHYEDLPKM